MDVHEVGPEARQHLVERGLDLGRQRLVPVVHVEPAPVDLVDLDALVDVALGPDLRRALVRARDDLDGVIEAAKALGQGQDVGLGAAGALGREPVDDQEDLHRDDG